ncbi:hypothetical protein McanMca71_003101 [Microsporum canis]
MNQTSAKARQTPEDEYPECIRAHPTQLQTRTPRFRLGPPPSQGLNVQFASTPHFLFGSGGSSQPQGPATDDEITQDDPENAPSLKRPSSAVNGEVIRDSDSETVNDQGISPRREHDLTITDDDDDDDDDDEMLLSLSPTLPRTKRRRQFSRSPSVDGDLGVRSIPGVDIITSSSPGSPSTVFAGDQMSPPSELHEEEFITPPRREIFPPRPGSQASLSARHPLFVAKLGQTDTPTPGNQTNSQAFIHNVIGPESTPRQKPRFVLPSTPDGANGKKGAVPITTPIPFSPLACRTKRVRAGSLVSPDFVPKGMAAEVRNWIFELGAKRLVTPHATPGSMLFPSESPFQGAKDADASQINPSDRYCLTREIASLKHSMEHCRGQPRCKAHCASAGHPAPFIMATLRKQGAEAELSAHQVLLFNHPLQVTSRTNPGFSSLQTGDYVGIRRGLAWEIEIDLTISRENDVKITEKASSACLVGVEWDILD